MVKVSIQAFKSEGFFLKWGDFPYEVFKILQSEEFVPWKFRGIMTT